MRWRPEIRDLVDRRDCLRTFAGRASGPAVKWHDRPVTRTGGQEGAGSFSGSSKALRDLVVVNDRLVAGVKRLS